MRESILKNFRTDLRKALENFERESGGRHNRRPEISEAMNTLDEYISRAQNPLILLNMVETYIQKNLSGLFKSLYFRDEYQLKKCLNVVLAKPEYSLSSLSHSLYHENETEKLQLYRLIAQLEERLRNIESGKEDLNVESVEPVSHSDFDDLRAKISHLEECERQAQIKISDLENKKWIDIREIIFLRAKIDLLSSENQKLKEIRETELEELRKVRQENQTLIEKIAAKPEKVIHKVAPQLVYQNQSKQIHSKQSEIQETGSCQIV